MSGKRSSARAQPQGVGVVHDRLEAQHVLAFGVALQRQQPEVDREQRQAIPRSVNHSVEAGRHVTVDAGPLLGPEQHVEDHSGLGARDVEHRRLDAGYQDEEHPGADLVSGQVLLGDAVLSLSPPAVDHRDAVGFGRGP
jgi:hypothetical protein